MNAQSVIGLVLCLVALPAAAGISAVPEPGTLELLALGTVVAVAIAIRKRRK